MPEDDKMLIVPLGEESKIITQTIANDTARKILELLAEIPMSTSSIAKKLDIPLTTAQYNIEKLMEAGLVVIEKTKYSEKGREVKMYAPAKRMIVLVPKTGSSQSLIDALKKYLVLLPIAALGAIFVEVAMQLRNGAGILGFKLPGGATSKAAGEAGGDPLVMSTMNNSYNSWGTPSPMPASVPESSGMVDTVRDAVTGSAGSVSGRLTTSNTTAGLPDAYVAVVNASNASQAYYDGANGTEAVGSGADLSTLAQAPPAVPDTTTVQGLIPTDLLNHWGLWFFIGCALILSLLVVYEVYTIRKGKGKKK